MALNYNELLARCCALEKAALEGIGIQADCLPRFFHVQEAFPYLTHRIGSDDVDGTSEAFDDDVVTVVIRLVVGHATSGYKGQKESVLYEMLPILKSAFNNNEQLQSETYPTAMLDLVSARIGSHSGLRAFANAGIAEVQVGSELILTCQFNETLYPEY